MSNSISILSTCAIEQYNQRVFGANGALTDEGEDENGASSSESELTKLSSGGRVAETERRLREFDAIVRAKVKRKRKFSQKERQ